MARKKTSDLDHDLSSPVLKLASAIQRSIKDPIARFAAFAMFLAAVTLVLTKGGPIWPYVAFLAFLAVVIALYLAFQFAVRRSGR
jgi:uncharacterized membrane protein